MKRRSRAPQARGGASRWLFRPPHGWLPPRLPASPRTPRCSRAAPAPVGRSLRRASRAQLGRCGARRAATVVICLVGLGTVSERRAGAAKQVPEGGRPELIRIRSTPAGRSGSRRCRRIVRSSPRFGGGHAKRLPALPTRADAMVRQRHLWSRQQRRLLRAVRHRHQHLADRTGRPRHPPRARSSECARSRTASIARAFRFPRRSKQASVLASSSARACATRSGSSRRAQLEAAATGWFVHVFVDRTSRRPTPFPAQIRAALERLRPREGPGCGPERSGAAASVCPVAPARSPGARPRSPRRGRAARARARRRSLPFGSVRDRRVTASATADGARTRGGRGRRGGRPGRRGVPARRPRRPDVRAGLRGLRAVPGRAAGAVRAGRCGERGGNASLRLAPVAGRIRDRAPPPRRLRLRRAHRRLVGFGGSRRSCSALRRRRPVRLRGADRRGGRPQRRPGRERRPGGRLRPRRSRAWRPCSEPCSARQPR